MNKLNTYHNIQTYDYEGENETTEFDAKNIIEIKNQQRMQKINVYNKLYNLCVKKIQSVALNGLSDCIFSLPLYDNNCPIYDLDECAQYIINRLNNNLFGTLMMTRETIFITWHFLELDLEKNKQ